MLALSFPILIPPKIYFWQVTAQVKGKFTPFNSQVHQAAGLTTIQETLRLLGIATGVICILKLYPHSSGTMQPLLCDQRQGS